MKRAFARVVAALHELADELDACGLRGYGTSVLGEARELQSMQLAAIGRLARANDNQGE